MNFLRGFMISVAGLWLALAAIGVFFAGIIWLRNIFGLGIALAIYMTVAAGFIGGLLEIDSE